MIIITIMAIENDQIKLCFHLTDREVAKSIFKRLRPFYENLNLVVRNIDVMPVSVVECLL